MIRASAPYTSGWGSFVLLKMDCIRVARGRQFEHVTPVQFFMQFSAKILQNNRLSQRPWELALPTGNPGSATD